MPFKSEAQRRKFAELVKEGKLSKRIYDEWNKETGKNKLPERIGHVKDSFVQKPKLKKYGDIR